MASLATADSYAALTPLHLDFGIRFRADRQKHKTPHASIAMLTTARATTRTTDEAA